MNGDGRRARARAARAAAAARGKAGRLTVGELKTARMEAWIGWVIAACAISAAAVSFMQIRWTVEQVGIPGKISWLVPLIVDGIATVTAAYTMSMYKRPLRQRAYIWTCFLVFIGLSIFCNWLHAITYVTAHPMELPAELNAVRWGIVFVLAAIPPVGAAIGMHVFAFTRRHGAASDLRASADATRALTGDRARPPVPASRPAADEQPPPVHAPAPPAGDAQPPAQPPRDVPAPKPAAHGDAGWEQLLTDPDVAGAWDAYRTLRVATGKRPSPTEVHAESGTTRNRSTVSRWMSRHFDDRWTSDPAARTAHTETVHAPAAPTEAVHAQPDTVHDDPVQPVQPVHAQAAVHDGPVQPVQGADVHTGAHSGAHSGVHDEPAGDRAAAPAHTDNGKVPVG